MNTLFKTSYESGAKLSGCRRYRYQLWRVWDEFKPYVNFIGLNPSTADEMIDDPTIRRCVVFAKDWGFGGLYMTNLFAFRATKPADMKRAVDAIGPDNDLWLIKTAADAGIIIAAWGKNGAYRDRDRSVIDRLPLLYCLRTNDDGTPEHPLYLPKSLKPVEYNGRE